MTAFDHFEFRFEPVRMQCILESIPREIGNNGLISLKMFVLAAWIPVWMPNNPAKAF